MTLGTYYIPYKEGTMTRNQARVMRAVGEKAFLRQIINGTGFSAQAAYSLVERLVETEILQAIDV